MSNKLKGKLAEEILSDEELLAEYENLDTEEIHQKKDLADTQIIYESIQSVAQKMSEKEKYALEAKIKKSISNHTTRKLLLWLSSTAAATVIAFGVYNFQQNNEKNIVEFANNIQAVPNKNTDNTRLILNGEEEIEIDSKDSKIEYLASGGQIKIDAEKKVEQVVEKEKPVYNTIIVPYGKRTQITLSDSSKIWLNSGTKLIYPAGFTGSKREVFLEGEAIFEVTKNEKAPFYVITKDIEIKVLGTVFNVSAYSDDKFSSAVLERGSVELKYKSNSVLKPQSKITMVPGTMAVYFPETKNIRQTNVDTRDYTCWKDGFIILHNETLQEITKRLSRYYNTPIHINNEAFKTETFSGRLDLKRSVETVLDVIAETTKFSLTVNNDEIIIN